ncbi:MAG: hypothetical protein AB7L09_21445 [Nitrospira sp.]
MANTNTNTPNAVPSVKELVAMSIEDFHKQIVECTDSFRHSNLEEAAMKRIAAIPRLPLSRDGRWWAFPMAHAYPFGN